jgi:Tol biopolymer transport system component
LRSCTSLQWTNIDGTGRTTVAGGDLADLAGRFLLRGPAWSPDGTRIAFVHEGTHIDTVAPNGTNRVHLDPMPLGFVFSPDWQPVSPGPKRSDYKNASQFCKAEQAFWGNQFASRYGGGKNAHGKCVSGK